jgi:hypothetical protein
MLAGQLVQLDAIDQLAGRRERWGRPELEIASGELD